MGRQILQTGQLETLDEASARVTKRSRKHIAVAGAFALLTSVGVIQGAKDLYQSDVLSRDPVKSEKLLFGSLWMALAAVVGGAGAFVMTPRIAKDQRSLERIEVARNEGRTLNLSRPRSLYRKDKDGVVETYGEAQQRVGFKLKTEFTLAVVTAIAGGGAIIDASFQHPALSNVILPVVRDMGLANYLSSMFEYFAGAASLGSSIALTVAANRHARHARVIESDVTHYGADARPRSRREKMAVGTLKPAENEVK